MAGFVLLGVFKFPGLGVEGAGGHLAGRGGLGEGELFLPPGLVDGVKILRQGAGRPAELYPPGPGGGDAFGLSLADVGPLVLGHEGEDLKDDVA